MHFKSAFLWFPYRVFIISVIQLVSAPNGIQECLQCNSTERPSSPILLYGKRSFDILAKVAICFIARYLFAFILYPGTYLFSQFRVRSLALWLGYLFISQRGITYVVRIGSDRDFSFHFSHFSLFLPTHPLFSYFFLLFLFSSFVRHPKSIFRGGCPPFLRLSYCKYPTCLPNLTNNRLSRVACIHTGQRYSAQQRVGVSRSFQQRPESKHIEYDYCGEETGWRYIMLSCG